MKYSIIIEPEAKKDLKNIFDFIKDNASIDIAKNFLSQLQTQIDSLSYMPQRCRKSLYYDDENTKDLIYKGYTISYHVHKEFVYIVAVFRQRNYWYKKS